MRSYNSSISVDCVILGFSGTELKLLLIKKNEDNSQLLKLPGSMIYNDEDVEVAAYRVLERRTGISQLYLKQLEVFSAPDRIKGDDLQWINNRYNLSTDRVVTVAYYSLLKLDQELEQFTNSKGAQWHSIEAIKRLALDHKEITVKALDSISKEFIHSPIAFELLPPKFTIRQLQLLYEAVLGVELDNRNFRKKISKLGYLTQTTEKEVGVAHKPAFYYTFNRSMYDKEQRSLTSISQIYF